MPMSGAEQGMMLRQTDRERERGRERGERKKEGGRRETQRMRQREFTYSELYKTQRSYVPNFSF